MGRISNFYSPPFYSSNMKRLLLITFFSFSFFNFSQEISIENWCHTSHKMNELKDNPLFLQQLATDNTIRLQEKENGVIIPKGIVYKIPIVFHILHNGGPENVDVSQIFNALDVINRDFRALNADTSEVIPLFKPLITDAEIEFVLATKAPDGSCFRGYTRTQSSLTFQGDDGYAQVNAVRNGNDVYQGNWPSNKYLNVYVIADAGGAGGYTNYPSNWGGTDMSNGIWILHTQFGEIGTSSLSAGRSLTHECGHWLNLIHPWGNSNNPGLASNCNEDDLVADTPNTRGASGSCNLNENGCGPIANTQNYMDYALSCQSMFTAGQVARMRAAIISSVGGRNNLWTAQNLIDTGADNNPVLCKADFSADRTSVCAGEQVSFTDESFNLVNGWTWTFNGGVPASSNSQNPIVTYNTPGLYEVTLSATDGNSNDSEVKTNYIRVLPSGTSLPFIEGFENYASLSNLTEWKVINNGGNGFEISSSGLNSSKSAQLLNFNETTGEIDELISSNIDLSGVSTSMTLSFRYAYKRKNSLDDDWLRVKVTNDCGQNWVLRKTIHGQILSSNISSTSFSPSSDADWTTVHMTNITSSFWVNNFQVKFEFESGGGNNFYIDNINIYEGAPSDEIVVGIEELSEVSQLSVYPNPTSNELNIAFNTKNAVGMELNVTSITGQIVQNHFVYTSTGSNIVVIDTNNLESGIYFIELVVDGVSKTIQFVVK